VITESLAFAEQFLYEALKEYEGNGIRYEPLDRQALIDLINEVDDLKKRLTSFMAGLAFMDHHPNDQTSNLKSGPVKVEDLFLALERAKYISPEGPLIRREAYYTLKRIFDNTVLSALEASFLLHPETSN
jgi:hypothetical protein